MIASVEAIFLSTFILISQNRMNATSEKRADLDLHITLLAEHEITKFFNWYRSQWNGLASAMAIAHERKKIVRGLTFRTELIRSIATAHG